MVVSDDGMRTSFITSSPADEGNAAWSPDGLRIAYVERTPEHFSGALKITDFDPAAGAPTGPARDLYAAPTDRGGSWSVRTPVWSPDGKQLAIVLQETGWDKVYLMPAAGGAPRVVTDRDGEDESPVFSPDGKSIAFVSNRTHPEERHIWIASIEGGAPRRITDLGPGSEAAPQWFPDGSKICFLHSTPLAARDARAAEKLRSRWLCDAGSGALREP